MPASPAKRVAEIVFGASVAVLGLAAPACASSPADVVAANDELIAAIKAADAAGGSPPRASDPSTAAKLAVAFDVTVLDQLKGSNAEAKEVYASATFTLMGYRFFGAKREIDPKIGAEAARLKITEIADRNSLIYQDEVTPGVHFTFNWFARQVPSLVKYIEQASAGDLDEDHKKGAAKLRHALMEALEGLITIQGEDYTPAHKQLILSDLARFGDLFIQSMGDEEREQVVKLVDTVLVRPALDKATRAQLEQTKRSLKTAPCSAVCRA